MRQGKTFISINEQEDRREDLHTHLNIFTYSLKAYKFVKCSARANLSKYLSCGVTEKSIIPFTRILIVESLYGGPLSRRVLYLSCQVNFDSTFGSFRTFSSGTNLSA